MKSIPIDKIAFWCAHNKNIAVNAHKQNTTFLSWSYWSKLLGTDHIEGGLLDERSHLIFEDKEIIILVMDSNQDFYVEFLRSLGKTVFLLQDGYASVEFVGSNRQIESFKSVDGILIQVPSLVDYYFRYNSNSFYLGFPIAMDLIVQGKHLCRNYKDRSNDGVLIGATYPADTAFRDLYFCMYLVKQAGFVPHIMISNHTLITDHMVDYHGCVVHTAFGVYKQELVSKYRLALYYDNIGSVGRFAMTSSLVDTVCFTNNLSVFGAQAFGNFLNKYDASVIDNIYSVMRDESYYTKLVEKAKAEMCAISRSSYSRFISAMLNLGVNVC